MFSALYMCLPLMPESVYNCMERKKKHVFALMLMLNEREVVHFLDCRQIDAFPLRGSTAARLALKLKPFNCLHYLMYLHTKKGSDNCVTPDHDTAFHELDVGHTANGPALKQSLQKVPA